MKPYNCNHDALSYPPLSIDGRMNQFGMKGGAMNSNQVSISLLACCLVAIPALSPAQTPPDPDASRETILDYYVQSYGSQTRLQNLSSFQIKWDSRNRSSSRESSRYHGRSLIGASAISWTQPMWSYRSWLGSVKRKAIGLVDNGEHMFTTGLESSGRLGPRARWANHLHRFVSQGAMPIGLWNDIVKDFELVGPAEIDGKTVWKLEAWIRLDRWVMYIDQDTGLAIRMAYLSRTSEHDTEKETYRFTF
ncbi:MAG: hypothetical protein ACR2NP_20460, partial [Pirellulaceae bacterium]